MSNDITNCKQFEKFLRLVTRTNILTVQRKRFTWMVSYKDAEGQFSQVYWQFSLKEPWLIPHFDDGTSRFQGWYATVVRMAVFLFWKKHTSIGLKKIITHPQCRQKCRHFFLEGFTVFCISKK